MGPTILVRQEFTESGSNTLRLQLCIVNLLLALTRAGGGELACRRWIGVRLATEGKWLCCCCCCCCVVLVTWVAGEKCRRRCRGTRSSGSVNSRGRTRGVHGRGEQSGPHDDHDDHRNVADSGHVLNSNAHIIIIIITETSKAPLTGAQRRRTVHDYTKTKRTC